MLCEYKVRKRGYLINSFAVWFKFTLYYNRLIAHMKSPFTESYAKTSRDLRVRLRKRKTGEA